MVECSASSNNEDADFLKPKQQQQQLSENSEQQQQTQSQDQQQKNDTNQRNQDQQNQEQHQQNQENQNESSDNTKPQQQQQTDPQIQQKQQANKLTEELFSTKGWGDTPIRQDTPWELPPSPSATANDSATNASGSSAHGPSNSSNLLGSSSTGSHHNQISSLNHNQPSSLSSLATTAVVPPGSGNQLLNHATSSTLANTHSTLAQQVGNLVGGDNGHSTLPPGISQSGDNNNFRARNDFNSHSMINNFGVDNINTANGLANSLGQMSIGGGASMHHQAPISSRFDQQQQAQQQQSWRAGPTSMVNKQHQQSSMISASPFANPNFMPKTMLNPGNAAAVAASQASFGIGGRQAASGGLGDFARAPGPTSSSMLDNNKNKSFAGGAPNRSSTWSAFGTSAYSDSNSEWPKSSGISVGGQAPTPFDLASDFGEQASKGWPNSMLMKSLEESAINAGPTAMNASPAAAIGSFPGGSSSYGVSSSKSPADASSGGHNDSSGIGTWSPVVKTGRPGSKWDSDGSDNGPGDSSRFDDGTSIWGSPFPTKLTGAEWGDKSGNAANGNVDEQQHKQEQQTQQRNIAGNNQAYRSPQLQQQQQHQQQQSSTAASMMMSSNYSPPTQHQQQHNRNQQQQQHQAIKQPNNLSQTFEQSNALTNQASQPNRGLGMSPSSNIVPSTQQLKHMVQQIQLAVQAGHLNPQILNQPLSPVTLQLLCQLLQQIKVLHQLQMQASKQQFGGNKSQQQQQQPGNHPAALNVQITKTKQNIINLQNQIAAQQANYLKTQQQAHNISSTSAAAVAASKHQQQQQAGAATMPTLAAAAAAASSSIGVGGHNLAPTLPPGISQSGDNNFRTGNDFHSQSMINNYNLDNDMGPNGLAGSLAGHMNLSGAGNAASGPSRFDQSWRTPMVKHQHQHQHQQQPSMATSSTSPFANPNLMNHSPSSMPKSMLNCGPGGGLGNGGPGVGLQSAYGAMQGDFARAPGPTSSSMMDNNKNKPFGVANRSSTWSAFGPNSVPNDSDSEWPKSSAGSIGPGGSGQHNAVDMVPEFEPGKPWRGSMLMKSVEDDPTMTPASLARSLAPQRKTIWSDEIL